MTPAGRRAAYIQLTLTALLWAGVFVVGKLAVQAASPLAVAALRFAGASAVFLILALGPARTAAGRVWRQDAPLLVGLGLAGVTFYQSLFFWGLALAPASDGAMIVPTLNPVITAVLAAFFLGERGTWRTGAGLILSLGGVALILGGAAATGAAPDGGRLLGDALFLASALGWAVYNVLSRVATRRMTPLAASAYSTAAGTVPLLALAAADPAGVAGTTHLAAGAPFWAGIAYMAVGGTVVPFLLWNRGIQRLGIGPASVFTNLVPVFSLFLAVIFLGERPAGLQLGGTTLVLAGVWLAAGPRRASSGDTRPVAP